MNLTYQQLLPQDFSPSSKVWVYQASRLFSLPEALEIEEMLQEFIGKWHSHGEPVRGYANLFFGRFIVLMADEEATGVSGCSTDSSVRLIKDIESRFVVSMFDRTSLAFILKDKIEILPIQQLQYAYENNFINPDTPYFNNLVSTRKELENNWIIPLRNSWLTKRLKLNIAGSE
jgi:hypothetical protein